MCIIFLATTFIYIVIYRNLYLEYRSCVIKIKKKGAIYIHVHSELTNRLRTCNRFIQNLDKMINYNAKIYM